MIDADVAIIGAGPAGAAAAVVLARTTSVVLMDRHDSPRTGIGESLPGAARHLLEELGIWDGFLRDGHSTCYAHRSRWGGEGCTERDGLADPDGPGWLLDRQAFDLRLRRTAGAACARVLAPARVVAATRCPGGWQLTTSDRSHRSVRVRYVIDASGRASRVLRTHGATRTAHDNQMCTWVSVPTSRPSQAITYVESDPDGWWYTAPLPCGNQILAFHTDADLPAFRTLRDGGLIRRAALSGSLLAALGAGELDRASPSRVCRAQAVLGVAAGDQWLAVGDAAAVLDPLSSQGLFHAIHSGIDAARWIVRSLRGGAVDASTLLRTHHRVWRIHQERRAWYYSLERRWPANPFWARRQPALPPPVQPPPRPRPANAPCS